MASPAGRQAAAQARRLDGFASMDSLFFPEDYNPRPPREYQPNLDIAAGRETGSVAQSPAF